VAVELEAAVWSGSCYAMALSTLQTFGNGEKETINLPALVSAFASATVSARDADAELASLTDTGGVGVW